MDPGEDPAFGVPKTIRKIKPGGELDTRSVAVGATVGAVSMVLLSVAIGGITTRYDVIQLVVAAVVTVSIPAGIVTGFLSSMAETDLKHGGFAGLFGTIFGIFLAGSVHSAMAPAPTIADKLDTLYFTIIWGFGTLAVVFLFILLVSGYVSRYIANLRWELMNKDNQEWGTKGQYDDDKEEEWGSEGWYDDEKK
jgi:fructose-specific phosphotransferase system IIC component